MWTMAFPLFSGGKWLTLSAAQVRSPNLCAFRAIAYLAAWPGMNAARCFAENAMPRLARGVGARSAASAVARIGLGTLLLFVVARHAPTPLLTGWMGMAGMVLLLHFGFFDLASIAWRALRVDAPPI